MSTSTVDEWKAIAENYRERLELLEKKLQEMVKVVGDISEPKLSSDEMKKRVIAMDKGLAYKRDWVEAVNNGLLENIQNILHKCYEYFSNPTEMGEEFVAKAKKMFGKHNSLEWQLFTLRVIQHLKNKGSFINGRGGFNTFETDEIVQNVAQELIENS
jgi:hypothetical protein